MKTDAYFSTDRRYRYWLVRVWDEQKPIAACIGVNPSKANESDNDPTVRKDIGFFSGLGFGGLLKLNAGAFVSTDPRMWRKALDPIGRENTPEKLREYIEHFGATLVVAAWGKNGNYCAGQCNSIREYLPSLMCFGINPDGTPRHTLMLAYSTPLRAFHDHHEGQNECTTCDTWAGKAARPQ